jgi:hypothetical protein
MGEGNPTDREELVSECREEADEAPRLTERLEGRQVGNQHTHGLE